VEPCWAFPRYNGRLPALPQRSGYIYLAHSPEYSLFGYDVSYLNELETRVKLLTSSRIPTDKARSSFTLSNFANDLNGAQTRLGHP